MPADRPTAITVPASVARRLRRYKMEGKTYADVMEELMDVVPPREFWEWALNELARPALPYSRVRKTVVFR